MGKIVKMPPHLANLIAAGEVVERPSNVVKELVENSIDAHSTSIKIYLKNGGLEQIKIVDDGDGMDEADVELAFMPHATSKIKTEYDLLRINTLGFRGEAIASICAVSTMNITSSTNGVEGYTLTYKAGVRGKGEICSSNKGTTITVEGLFFNTPARLKYMKSAKSELSSILFYVDRLAMAHPDMKIVVYHDNKIVFQTSGSANNQTLIGELYGIDAARNILEHSYQADGYKMRLLFIKPQVYRANKLEITLICNGRYVKSYIITNAVVEAFATYVPIGKYPIGIIYLDIDPISIDVNVHPTKTEIKISDEEAICYRLKTELKNMLSSTTHIPTRVINTNEAYVKPSIFDEILHVEELKQNTPTFTVKEEVIYFEPKEEVTPNEKTAEVEEVKEVKEPIEAKTNTEPKIPYMEYVGSVFGTYLIFQNTKGMYLVDQHAAAERINYEKNYKLLASNNQPRMDLIVPIMLEFSKSEALYVEQNLSSFEAIGFTLEEMGPQSFALRGIPLWAHVDKLDEIIYDILELMIENHEIDVMKYRDHIAKQISCKGSIKANQLLSRNEIDKLIENLNKCENPYTCPHGRPTIIKFSVSDLEKMFERIQK